VKHKVCELEGALLDVAVALACGSEAVVCDGVACKADPRHYAHPTHYPRLIQFCPSTDWADGGPIIDRERIALIPPEPIVSVAIERAASMQPGAWLSWQWGDHARRMSHGPTPLVAGMRSYVASRFGEEVELP
jgi:Protein of unknown function (DUF2591)